MRDGDDDEEENNEHPNDPDYSKSASIVEPYVIRDNAWNFREHDATNFYDYRDAAPDGYKEQIEYEDPHQTNMPYRSPIIAPELCEQNAQMLMNSAQSSADMKMAKAKLDGCIADLKAELNKPDADTYKKFVEDEKLNAELQ